MTQPFGHLLLVYYHPIVFDLAQSFSRLFKSVDICVVPGLKDNYGGSDRVIKEANSKGLNAMLSPMAIARLKRKQYDLVGLDGVFEGDRLIGDVCNAENIPLFCINGYPHNRDEPSKNILSFSHFLPQIQYRSVYPTEMHVKELDWGNIARGGQSEGKNVCVYYPELADAKKHTKDIWKLGKEPSDRPYFISLIHRFKECNEQSYKVFEKVKSAGFNLENYTSLSEFEVIEKLTYSHGFIHLKHADCPGISLLQAMLSSCPPFVMTSFVNASHDQELLIDNYSAVICDSVDEMIERMKIEADDPYTVAPHCKKHAEMLTSWDRQEKKVTKFFERCLNA